MTENKRYEQIILEEITSEENQKFFDEEKSVDFPQSVQQENRMHNQRWTETCWWNGKENIRASKVNRYLCTACGYSEEEWIDLNDIEKLSQKYNQV